jgi:hypothetical protein
MRKWITPVSLSVSLVLSALACRLVVQRSAQESAPMTDRQAVATISAATALDAPRAMDFCARKPEAAVGLSVPAAATVASTSSQVTQYNGLASKQSATAVFAADVRQPSELSEFSASRAAQIGQLNSTIASEAVPMATGSLRSQTSSETPHSVRITSPAQPSLPLAFQDANPAVARLNEAQQPAIAQLRQQFVNDIGGQDADSSTPEYLNRWRNAQPASDTQFRGFFGQKAFLDSDLAAGQAAAQSAPAN